MRMRFSRRGFLARAAGALVLPVLARNAWAQTPALAPALDPQVQAFARGALVRPGRVTLAIPSLADNGNSVPARITVDSPMTATDHVKAIRLVSDRNPERVMATFHLGPHAGRADISTRVRLAGSQRVTAVAECSDGTFWYDARSIVVTLSACLDES